MGPEAEEAEGLLHPEWGSWFCQWGRGAWTREPSPISCPSFTSLFSFLPLFPPHSQ